MERLRYREKGIGAELIYPRFTAAMLRLGDVLDVENNRFSLYSVEHMSQMPEESSTHMLKHEAISHIIITPEEIQVEAESDQIEVCQCAQDWFHLIEREVQDLIYSWNEIAPPLLRGCTLKRSQCYVYLLDSNNKKHAYHLERQRRFEVDKEKLTDLWQVLIFIHTAWILSGNICRTRWMLQGYSCGKISRRECVEMK